jgi:DNA polymerase-3 subunit gamma/tau
MPYVVLARRWRPKLFKDVVGQEHVTKTLQNAISSNRIAHAYLFSGPRGVGKTSVARVFAKAVNCQKGLQTEPCGECKSCKEITANRSIDIIEIDAASNRGIDEIRELRESVKFAPVSGRYKVYIIDEAHMLTMEAFNALLKTLEEPPEHVIFILATTEPHKLPATILSRCQRFDFRMLTRQEIVDRLKEMAKADELPIDDEALSLIAESADGGMRDAESILDQLMSFSGGEIRGDEVSKLLGLGANHLIDQLVTNILQNKVPESLETLNDLTEHGADLSQCLKKLVSYFRDLMVYKVNPALIDASETRQQQLAKLSEGVSIERLVKISKILIQTEGEIKQLGYERLNIEIALVKLSKLRDDVIPLDQVLGKLEEMESKLASGVIKHKETINETGSIYNSESSVSVEEEENPEEESDEYEGSDPLKKTWMDFLRSLKNKGQPMLHALLREASPVSITDSDFIIEYDHSKFSWHQEQVQETENKKEIEAELSEVMGKPMKLKIKSDESTDNPENTKQEAHMSPTEMRQDAMQDDNVRLVTDIFNGRVVEVKEQ